MYHFKGRLSQPCYVDKLQELGQILYGDEAKVWGVGYRHALFTIIANNFTSKPQTL